MVYGEKGSTVTDYVHVMKDIITLVNNMHMRQRVMNDLIRRNAEDYATIDAKMNGIVDYVYKAQSKGIA